MTTSTHGKLAMIGIHVHTALPAIFLVLGVLFFWKMNDLGLKKVAGIKAKLTEKGL